MMFQNNWFSHLENRMIIQHTLLHKIPSCFHKSKMTMDGLHDDVVSMEMKERIP